MLSRDFQPPNRPLKARRCEWKFPLLCVIRLQLGTCAGNSTRALDVSLAEVELSTLLGKGSRICLILQFDGFQTLDQS